MLLAGAFDLVRRIAAVIVPITDVVGFNADGVVALELVGGTVPPVRITGRTVSFVGDVAAVLVAVADEIGRDAVSAGTLELIRAAFVIAAVLLIGSIVAVGVVVAAPLAWDAAFVRALELALGTVAIEVLAERSLLV